MESRTTSTKKKKKKEDYYGALHLLPPVVIPPLASGYRPESRRLRLPDVHQSSSDCRRGKLDTQWKEELNSDLENRSKMTSFPRLLVQSPISRDIAIYQLRKMVQERGSKGFLAQEMTGKDRFLPELPQKGNRPTQNLKVLQVRRPIELTWKQCKGTERADLISMKGEFSETPQPVQSKKTPKSQKQREIILEDNLKDKLQERMDNLRGKDDTVKKEYLNEIFDSEKQEKSQKNDKDNRSVIKEDISTISADNIPSNFFGEMSTNSSSSTYLFRQLSDGEIKIIEDSLCGTITMVELNDLSESIVAWVVVSISRVLLPAISLYEERSRSLSQSSFQSQVHISTNEETLQATLSSHSLTRTGSHCSVQVQRKSSGFICGRSRTSTPFASPCSSLTSLENYAEEERGNDAPSHIKTGTPSPRLVDTEGREKIEADSSEPLKKLFGIPNSTIIKNADCIVQDVIGRALIEIQHPAPQEEPWHSHVRSLIPSSRSSNLASKILDDVLECVNSALSTSIQQNSTKRPANGVPDHLETQEVESTDSQVARRILQLVSEKLEPCFTDTVEAVTQEEMESELGIVASEIINAVLEEIKTVKDRQRVSELTPDVPQNREMVTSIGSSVTRSSSFQLVPLKHIETVEEVFPKQETEAKCFLTCDINPRSFESPVGTKRVLKENVMGISESEINNTPKKLVKREVRPVAKCLADRHKSESRGRATLLVSQVMMRAAAKLKSFNPSDLLETPVSITGEAALLTALDMPKHSQRTVSLGSSSFYLEVNAAASGLVDAILEKLQRAAATEKHKDTKEACNSDFPPEFETAVSSRQVHSVNEDVFKTVMTKLKHFFSQDTLIAFSAAKRSPDKQDKLDGPLKHFPTLKRVLPQTNSGEPYSFKESHLMQKSVLPICPNASEHLGVLRDISSLRPILKSQDIQLMVKTCAQDIVCQLMQTIKSEMNRVETMRATLSEESLLASLQVDTIIIRIETVKVSELNLSLNAKESEKDRKADEEAVGRKKICSRQHVQTVNAPATVFPSHMGQVEYCSRNIPGQTPSSIFPKLPSRMSLVAKQGDTVASEIRQLSQALVWKELSTSPDLIKESPSNGTLREPERARAASVEEGDHSLTSPTCATPAGTIQAAISLSDIDFIAMKIVDRIVTRLELLACAEDQCNRATNKDTSECDVTPTSKSRAHESVGRIHKVSHGLQVPGATANVSLLQIGGPEERGCSNSSIAVAPTMNAAGKTLVGILTSSIPSLFSEELIDTVSKVISESSITKKLDNNPNSETADKNLKTSVFSIQFLILYAERSVRKLLELCLTFPGSQSRESEEHDVFGAPHVFNKKFYTVEQKMPGKESVTNSGHGLEKTNHSSQIHNDALDLLTRVLVQFVINVLFASYDLPLEPNNSDSEGIARSVSVESTQETLEDKVILDRDTKRFSKGNVPGSDSTAHSLHTEERKIDGKLTQTTRGRPLLTYGVLPPIKERPRQGQPSSKDEPGQQTVGELQTEEGMSPGERPWNKKQEPPAKGEKPVCPPQLDNDNDNASANAKAKDNAKAGDEAGASNGSVPLVSSAPCSDTFGEKRIISGLFEKIRPGFPRDDTGELELVPESQLTELTPKLTEHVMKKIVRIPSLASCNADEQEHLLLQHVKRTTRAVYRSMVEATGCKRDLQIAVGSRNPETMKRIICRVARHIQEGEFAQGTNSPPESLNPKDDSNRTTEKIRVMIPPRANKILPSPMNSSSDFPKKKVGGMKEMGHDRVSAGESFDLRNVSNEKRERFAPESSKKPKESIVPRELDVDEQHHAKAAKKKSLKAKKKRSLEAESSTSTSLRQPSEHEIKPLVANLMYAEFRHKEKGKKNIFRKMVNFGTRMKNRLQFKLRNDQNVPYYEAHMSSDAFERMPQAGPRGKRKEQTSEAPRPGVNSGFLPLIPQKPQLTSAVVQSEPCHNASADRGNLLEIYEIQGTSSSFNSSGKRELMQLRDKNSIPQTVRKKIFEKESGPPERYQWSQPRSAMPEVSAPQPNPREKPPKSSVLTRVSAALARVFQKKK